MRITGWFGGRGKADPLGRAVEAYEWDAGPGGPPLARYWAGLGSGQSPSILAALVKVDLRRRFESGERPRALEYLRAFPVLAEVRDRVVSLVYEEFCLLEESGERPDSGAFCEDYGPWRDSLRAQLMYHRELSQVVGAPARAVDFPEPGDRFDKYRLTSILGEGGIARVYLATEEELGDRQVAIKVSASFGQEPSIHGKLDHRNIVPILTVAHSESGLRGICMPYRPGATLDDLIKRIGRGAPPRSARAIGDALRPGDSPAGFPLEETREGWAGFPANRTFPEAVAWIGLALANALAYLHEKGVFHRDIKPANILLAYKEGPQLLDFNLAQEPNNPEVASDAQKGGTLPYMAPEQLRAFVDPSAWDDVGSAADLYSLGLVLRELLTGRPPELPTSRGSLAREIQSLIDRRLAPPQSIGEINPGVPPALGSIIGKCLELRPADRYASADDLAADLRRFLDRKPLRVAPNTSRIELAVNWAYRNRHSILATALFLAALASLNGALPRAETREARLLAAGRHLDSGRPADLKGAREEFETLHRERPDAASALGLALTLLKLGHPADRKLANELLRQVAQEDDAARVIRARLEKEPRSALLHLTLGIVLERHEKNDLARQSLERSLEIDPGGYSALVALARIDQKEDRAQDALGHLARAIGVGVEKKIEAEVIYELRKFALHLLVGLIDRRLEPGGGAGARAEAASYLRQLESQLRALGDDRRMFSASPRQDEHSYTVPYFEGCISSIRGALEPDGGDPDRSARFFDEALRHFERCRALASAQGPAGDRLPPIEDQDEKLVRRRLGRRRGAWPAPPSGGAGPSPPVGRRLERPLRFAKVGGRDPVRGPFEGAWAAWRRDSTEGG